MPGVPWVQCMVAALCCIALGAVYHTLLAALLPPAHDNHHWPSGVGLEAHGHTAPLPGHRLAFFVSLHDAVPLEQARRVLRAIYSPEHLYLVHVDGSSREAYHEQVAKHVEELARYGARGPNVAKMWSMHMGWGSIFTVQHTLEAIRILASMGDWDHFINLSGSDYPAQPVAALTAFLAEHRHVNFIKYGAVPASLDVRLAYMFLPRRGEKLRNTGYPRSVLNKTTPESASATGGQERWGLPRGFKAYKSSAWFVLSRSFCNYLTTRMIELVPLVVWASNIAAPDEVFFQTAIFNSPFANTTLLGDIAQPTYRLCGTQENHECGDSLRFISWSGAQVHPDTLTIAELGEIQASSTAFFIRKIALDEPKSRALCDELDRLHQHERWKPT